MGVREVFTYVIGFLLMVSSFVIGIRTDFLGILVDPPTAVLASLSVAIGVFLVTDRLAASGRDAENYRNMSKLVTAQAAQLSQYNQITQFPTSDEAMDYLCSRLPNARVVYNTKISSKAVPPNRTVGKRYEEALIQGLKHGMVYKDVISPGFKDYAVRLKQAAAGTPGRYDSFVASVSVPSFINFIVLEFATGEEELLIGWATSAAFGTEQKAFKVLDVRMIAYFKTYHSTLLEAGKSA